MRIGIDMRMAGTGEGIARYIEELVCHLAEIDRENEYVLLFQDADVSTKFKIQNPKFRKQIVYSKYYSFAEQAMLIWELWRLKLDLVHFPSFNAPVFYPGRFVVTIHDIIHHHFPGKKKSHLFHRLAYRFVIKMAIKRSKKIIAVSENTKNELVRHYSVPDNKISLIYEGVRDSFFQTAAADQSTDDVVRKKFDITKPYLLFVGVWRKYKNLPFLARVFDILKERYGRDCQLVLAGKIDPFYPEIRREVFASKHAADLRALGYVSDLDLQVLYRGASAFVLPSLIEGFGLIGIEAQAAGTVVIASDIPVLREILGDAAAYFDPKDELGAAEKINRVLTDAAHREALSDKGLANVKRFDWNEAARQTLMVYKNVL